MIKQVANKFNGVIIGTDSVKFNFGEDSYVITDGTIYTTTEDGEFLPGFKRVKSLLAVENFVAARA